MPALQLYQVISSLPIVIQDGALAISYSPGQLFNASPKLPSVINHLLLGNIAVATANSPGPQPVELILDSQLAELYVKANGTRAFSGHQSMGGHYLTNLLDPLNAQDAATKAYVDAQSGGAASQLATTGAPVTVNTNAPSVGQVLVATSATNATWQTLSDDDTLFLRKDGSIALTGNWDIGGTFRIRNSPDPALAQDVATKNYVDLADALFIKKDGSVAYTGSQSLGGFNLTSVGSLVFAGSTSGTVSFAAPAIAGTQSYTLPAAIGAAGTVLTDVAGNGVLSWAATSTTATALATTGSPVTVSGAAPPSTGQVLTATSATTATWQTPSGGGGGTLQASYTAGGAGGGAILLTLSGGPIAITNPNGAAQAGLTVTQSNAGSLAATFSGGSISVPGPGTTSERFGAGATINNTGNFAIAIGGTSAVTNGNNDCIAIGHTVTAGTASGHARGIAIGKSVTAGGTDCIIIGNNGTAGDGNTQGSDDCIAIGNGVIAGNPFLFDFACVAIGQFNTGAGGFLPTSNPGGTVTVTNGSPTVTGTTVGMFDGFQVGSTVYFSSQPTTGYTISAVPNNFTLTLSTNYTGTSSSGVQVGTANGNGGYVAIGEAAGARGGRGECIAIGTSTIAGWGPSDQYCVALGRNAKAQGGTNLIAIGQGAQSKGTSDCIAIGNSASAGNSTTGISSFNIAIGIATANGLQHCVAVGSSSAGTGGTAANAGDQYCFAYGNATAACRTGFAGPGATTATNGSGTVTNPSGLFTSQLYVGAEIMFSNQVGTYYTVSAIASDTSLTITPVFSGTTSSTLSITQRVRNVIVLGGNGAANGEVLGGNTGTGARFANVLVAGSVAGPITDVYFGSGIRSESSTAPSAAIIHGSGGSKTTNQNGAAIGLAGGLGYSDANAGGDINFYTARTSTAHSLTFAGRFRATDGTFSVPGSGGGSERFGLGALAGASNSTAVGPAALVTAGATGGTAVGVGANIAAPGLHAVALGDAAFIATTAKGIAIGWGAGDAAISGAADNIAIGDGPVAGGHNDCIAIGDFCQAGNTSSHHDDIAIGNSAIIYGLRNIGIGFGPTVSASTTAHDTIVLGSATADWGGSNSQSNALIGGSSSNPITDVWFGSGMNTGGAAPTTWSLRGSENWGSVSNKNGGQLNIVAGRGWNGGIGADVHIRTSNVAGASAIGTEQDVGVFDHLGNAQFGLGLLADTATDGFVYIPTVTPATVPTGTPTAKSGYVAMHYDVTNNKLWIYNGGWKTTSVFA